MTTMSEQEYIHEAVRLADDWYITHIFAGEDIVAYNPKGGPYPEASFILQAPSQSGKDALAAQLVRQVDALEDFTVLIYGGVAWVLNYRTNKTYPVGHSKGRTMNTLRAIVDSEVLL